jgi:Ca2+-binding RTX toxin-like protein
MSITINGNQTDFSFTRDGSTLQVLNANRDVVQELTNDFTVVFSDGTVNLSQSINNLAAESSTVSYGSPSSTVLKDGGYVLTWEYYNSDDSENGILLQQYDAVGALVTQTKLTSSEAEDPSVTAKSDGGYIVAWSASTDSTSSILIQQFTKAGVATAKAQTVTTSNSDSVELDDAVVAMLPNGKFVVTWSAMTEDESSGDWTETGDLFSQLYNANGTKVGSAQKINGATVDGTVAEDQNVLPTEDGFLVSYVKEWSTPGANGTVYHSALEVRSFNASGIAVGQPKELTSLDSQYQNASYPSLLVTEDGYLMTWVATVINPNQSFGRGLLGQKLDKDFNPVGDEQALTPTTDSNANDASLTQLSNGQFVAVWTTFEGGAGNSVYAQVYTGGLEKIGGSILVKAAAGTYEPNVTALKDGGFLVNWVANSYTEQSQAAEMLSQRYDANGNAIGNITTVISGDDSDNTLTWDGAGAVTLQGYNGDDTLTGGAGDDTLDGGNGNDTVIASGNLAGSSFSLQNGAVVLDGEAGKDALISIENVTFDDATITINDGSKDLESAAQAVGEEAATAALNDGSQVVVWKQDGEVMLQLYRDGVWQQVDATGIQYGYGTLAVSALGDGFIVSWGEESDGFINAQRFDADGEEVGVAIHQAAIDPQREIDDISVTQLKEGGFVLAWTEKTPEVLVDGDYTDSIGNGYFQVYNAQGTASAPVALATGSLSAFEPSVSALQNGGFVVVWEYVNDAKESEEIYIQRFKADGSPDGKASQVNTGTKGDQGDPQVATLADGGYVVTWTRETDDDRKYTDQFGNQHVEEVTTSIDIFQQRYTADGKKAGGETQVNQGTGFHNDPVITALKDGGYVIAWATSDERDIYNGDSSLYAQIFDKNGVKVGDQLVVASSDDEDYFPSISASPDGGFLITWEAGERDNSVAKDIYAKQYDANGNSVTLTGDTGDNTINWTGKAGITLNGGDGDDTLTGGEGNDTLLGGDGNDVLDGQGGSNLLIGGAGDDTYVVHSVKDQISEVADGGDDTVQSSITWTLGANLENLLLTGAAAINGTGNALNNVLNGNDAKNTLNGGDGDDFLAGAGGADTLIGGNGNDTFYVDLVLKGSGAKAVVALEDTVVEAANGGTNDTLLLRGIFNTAATTTLTLGANLETFDASLTGNTLLNLTGNALANTLIGNDANNVLSGGAGIDTLVGGKGDDTYVIDDLAELSNVNNLDGVVAADDGNDTLRIALKGGTVSNPVTINLDGFPNLADVENIQITGTGVFNLGGNGLDNRLDLGKASGTLAGGEGDDTYVLTSKTTQVIENADAGTDTIEASFTADLNNYANVENLTLTGKAAINATGNSSANVLTGNDGANILDGGAGADTLMGGKGNDTYIVDNVGDTVSEDAGGGVDTIKSSVDFNLSNTPFVENLTLTAGALSGFGNDLANTLTGNSADNLLYGGAGADKLIGGAGNDIYIVDLLVKGTGSKATLVLEDTITEKKDEGDHDTLYLQVGNDAQAKLATAKATTLTLANYLENVNASDTGLVKLNLTGNAADNFITGNDAGNTLNGAAGNDVIIGGSGDDLIIGGVGADTLTGNGGADTFSFTSLKDLGLGDSQDVITDFVSGTDHLDFKALKGWSFSGVVGDDHQATGAKQLWAVVENGDTIVYGNSGGSNAADFSIKLTGVTSVTSDDFVLA